MKQYDLVQKMFFVGGARATFSYERYGLHKQQMLMQFDRTYSAIIARNTSRQSISDPSSLESVKLFMDHETTLASKVLAEMHLLFISIDNMWDMLKCVMKEPPFNQHESSLYKETKAQSFFDRYTAARNSFEHFDERIPGGSKHKDVQTLQESPEAGPRKILGGLSGYCYMFGDQKYDIGPKERDKAIGILCEFEILVIKILTQSYET